MTRPTAGRSSSPATPAAGAMLERFRELNQRQLRELLGRLDADELAVVNRSFEIFQSALDRGAPEPVTANHHHRSPGGAPIMSRLSQLAVSKRSVTLLLASALFVAGIAAWGASSRSSCRTSSSRSSRSSPRTRVPARPT